MESSHDARAAGALGDETSDELARELPPIKPRPRPRCRSCHRDDRPIFGTVCGWCSDRE